MVFNFIRVISFFGVVACMILVEAGTISNSASNAQLSDRNESTTPSDPKVVALNNTSGPIHEIEDPSKNGFPDSEKKGNTKKIDNNNEVKSTDPNTIPFDDFGRSRTFSVNNSTNADVNITDKSTNTTKKSRKIKFFHNSSQESTVMPSIIDDAVNGSTEIYSSI